MIAVFIGPIIPYPNPITIRAIRSTAKLSIKNGSTPQHPTIKSPSNVIFFLLIFVVIHPTIKSRYIIVCKSCTALVPYCWYFSFKMPSTGRIPVMFSPNANATINTLAATRRFTDGVISVFVTRSDIFSTSFRSYSQGCNTSQCSASIPSSSL